MAYKCCEYLLHQIVFDQTDIKPCCETSMNNNVIKFVEDFDGFKFDIKQYIEKRQIYIEKFKSNNIPLSCQHCPLIKESEWDENNIYFDRIIMANIAKCSCNCIYCVYTHDNPNLKSFYNSKKAYDIKPILLNLRNQNLLKDNFILIIGGGECTEFPKGELEWLLYFASACNGKIQILSSGIKYSKAIEQILKAGKVELCISPDAGTRKTYEEIKRVKAFNLVWDNLKNYIIASFGNSSARIEVKYIIIPGINDNEKEIKAFIKKCKEIKCQNIHIDVEHYWYKENKNKPVTNKIKNIMNILKEEKGIYVSYSIETQNWLNNI